MAALNEEKVIAGVIKDLHKHGYKHIVVVDDGSTDGTAKQVEKAGAEVLKFVVNRGQGAALRTGMEYALSKGADIIVTFDSDGQHQAKDIVKLIDPIKKGEVKAVLGSRFIDDKTKMPLTRKVLLQGSRIVQFIFYGMWLTDAHNGFRALHKDAVKRIKLRSDRMGHSHEFAEQIHKHRIPYKEQAVEIKYNEYTLSKGHGGIFQAFRVLGQMIKDKVIK